MAFLTAIHGSCTVPNECICDEGYTGESCDVDIDVCGHQQPCAMGSTCTNTGPEQYVCSCAAGFTGQNCDTEINECSPNPCLNGATCLVGPTPYSLCYIYKHGMYVHYRLTTLCGIFVYYNPTSQEKKSGTDYLYRVTIDSLFYYWSEIYGN